MSQAPAEDDDELRQMFEDKLCEPAYAVPGLTAAADHLCRSHGTHMFVHVDTAEEATADPYEMGSYGAWTSPKPRSKPACEREELSPLKPLSLCGRIQAAVEDDDFKKAAQLLASPP